MGVNSLEIPYSSANGWLLLGKDQEPLCENALCGINELKLGFPVESYLSLERHINEGENYPRIIVLIVKR